MRTWLRRFRRVVWPSPSASPVSRYQPTLEALEERALLATAFVQTNLIADTAGVAAHTDPNVVNPWGISFGPSGPFWLSDNGTGVSSLNDGSGGNIPLVVNIPPLAPHSHPTGTVYNGNTSEFLVSGAGSPSSASFLFATEEGTISGWNGVGNAIQGVDSSGSGAVYKGLAIARQGNNDFLYATDFHNGRIDVFDKTFAQQSITFTDPNLPAGFAPFGIQNINGTLFVTYAKQLAPGNSDDDPGPGNGFVDEFRPDGSFVKRLVSNGVLNSPWGLALAPAGFGPFGGALLVGNFGDGTINAFDPATGTSLGSLQDASGQTIHIDGLWGIAFGNGAGAGSASTLYFTAGPGDETHGLFGSLEARTTTPAPGPEPAPTPTPTPTPVLLDVSALVGVKKVLPRNHRPNPRQQKVTLRNNGGNSITGPLFLIVSGLPANVKVRNATGFTKAHGKPGDPFVRFDLSALASGQTVGFTLLLANPKNKAVRFTALVLAGTGTV
jgi:uncharacterized protein (TIGR03118 family)